MQNKRKVSNRCPPQNTVDKDTLLSLTPVEHGSAFHCSLRNCRFNIAKCSKLITTAESVISRFCLPNAFFILASLILRSREAEFSCFLRSIPLIISAILPRSPSLYYHKSRYVKHVHQKLKFTRGACRGISAYLGVAFLFLSSCQTFQAP